MMMSGRGGGGCTQVPMKMAMITCHARTEFSVSGVMPFVVNCIPKISINNKSVCLGLCVWHCVLATKCRRRRHHVSLCRRRRRRRRSCCTRTPLSTTHTYTLLPTFCMPAPLPHHHPPTPSTATPSLQARCAPLNTHLSERPMQSLTVPMQSEAELNKLKVTAVCAQFPAICA